MIHGGKKLSGAGETQGGGGKCGVSPRGRYVDGQRASAEVFQLFTWSDRLPTPAFFDRVIFQVFLFLVGLWEVESLHMEPEYRLPVSVVRRVINTELEELGAGSMLVQGTGQRAVTAAASVFVSYLSGT